MRCDVFNFHHSPEQECRSYDSYDSYDPTCKARPDWQQPQGNCNDQNTALVEGIWPSRTGLLAMYRRPPARAMEPEI